jgi:hypothetical protein
MHNGNTSYIIELSTKDLAWKRQAFLIFCISGELRNEREFGKHPKQFPSSPLLEREIQKIGKQ